MKPGQSFLPALDRFTRYGSAIVVCVGAAVVIGWFANIPALKSALPGLATMKMNTACAFILAGVSLRLLHTSTPGSNWRTAARILALCLITIAGLTVAQDLFGLDFGIDQFIVPDVPASVHEPHPGRMAPVTSLSFFVIGIVLFGLKSKRHGIAVFAHWFALLPLFLSVIAILGYTYGARSLYDVKPFSTMAIHTAVTLFILTLSIKAADPMHGIANIMSSDTAGGLVCRRLLPTLPLALYIFGYIRLKGQQAGLYDLPFGLALMVSMSVMISVLAIVLTAYTLRRVDLTRKQAQSEILALNVDIEDMLQKSMQQVAQLSAALTANQSLEQMSLHDSLTGLGNRRLFDTYLAGQIAIARRRKRALVLVLCDVDEFKSYNDRYGHQAGDACLVRIAAALQSCCRRPGDMAARYGGEEFALVLPDTELAGAEKIAEAARDTVAHLDIEHTESEGGPQISISGGIAVWKMGMTAEQLIAMADESLYKAKREGRNRMISAQAA
jgi:diguanylate cyclase (GGDEF)-like protein